MESFILTSILIIGSLWLILLGASFWGISRTSVIDESSPGNLPPNAPFVSILVPARNEEANIGKCLESLLAQDYPHFEIIVANDRSTDRTEEIVRELAQRFPRLRLLNVDHLPEGWTGKTHALHLASKQARGEWLVFTDADTHHSPACLRKAMNHILHHKADLFSTVGRMDNQTWWERCLTPLLGLALMMWYPPPLVNSKHSKLGFANGQFIIARRSAYDAFGGHEAVRSELLEDIAMGKRAKQFGFRVRLALAPHLYTTRMYPDFRRFFYGWSRILLNGLDKSPFKLAAFFFFGLVMSIYPTVLTVVSWIVFLFDPELVTGLVFLLCVLVYLVKVWTVSNTYFVSGSQRRYAFLNPINTLVVLAIVAHAFYKVVHPTGRIEWRGTQYSAR